MIKIVFFDFDGVLSPDRNDGFTTCQYISEQTGIEYDKLYAAYSPHLQSLYAGKVTNADVWPDFQATLGQEVDIELAFQSFDATPRHEEMLKLAKSIKAAGYAIGIITNQTVERYERLRKPFELDETFDPVVVSAAVGTTKAGEFGGEEIFKVALGKHGNKPDEVVFIDNTEANLIIPAKMGIKTIYHDDAVNDMALLEKRLHELEVNWDSSQ